MGFQYSLLVLPLVLALWMFNPKVYSLEQNQTTPLKDLKQYSLQEVAQHNKESSCWIIIDSNVYDVTSYIGEHPAPKIIMKKACGTDATKVYADKKGMGKEHSEKAQKQKEKFLIGRIN